MIFNSCKKEFTATSINDLTSDYNGDVKELFKIRLAFGQTVANATHDITFRKYILKTSQSKSGLYFDEILFALHKDDIVANNKTLTHYLNSNISKETEALYGPSFVESVLRLDPLVIIKIPDVFLCFDWDDCIIPMTYVRTPEVYIDEAGIQSFPAFHPFGYTEMIDANHDMKYLCFVVKPSEDYLLLDFETKMQINGLKISRIIPQAALFWDDIKSELLLRSKKGEIYQNFRYVKLRDIKVLCDPLADKIQNDYISINIDSCSNIIYRDCRDFNDILTFIDSIELQQQFAYSGLGMGGSWVLKDNINIQFQFKGQELHYSSFYGMKYAELFQPNIEIDCKMESTTYEGIGRIELPRITFPSFLKKKTISIPTSIQIKEPLIQEGYYISIRAYDIEFRDIIYPIIVNNEPVYSSHITEYGSAVLIYSTPPSYGAGFASYIRIEYNY